MNRRRVIDWTMKVCLPYIRRSRAKTLSVFVWAAMHAVRISLAGLGRCAVSRTSVKHRIKRLDRFLGNDGVEPSEAMRGVVDELVRHRCRRLTVCLDWTEIRSFMVLAAGARVAGRSVLLSWAVYRKWEVFRSQNSLEEALLRLLRTMVPQRMRVLILADRGFGRTEMARLCQQLGFSYIIRIRPNVTVEGRDYHGKLIDLPVRRGTQRFLRDVAYRKHRPVRQHVAVIWKRNLEKDRDEPWFLMTNVDLPPMKLAGLYRRRMTIEELFRDQKNVRCGWALRHTEVKSPERLSRLILILAVAYILLVALGTTLLGKYRAGLWSSTNKGKPSSAFAVGQLMLDHMPISLRLCLKTLAHTINEMETEKWG